MAEAFRERVRAIEAAAAVDEAAGESFGLFSTPSLPPYGVPPALQPTIDRLGLQRNIDEMKERGYTVLRDVATMAEVERINAVVLNRAKAGIPNGITKETMDLFGHEPEFDRVALNETMCALAEVMCGQGFLLSQMVATVNKQVKEGTRAYQMHSDQNWLPAPFPEHNQVLTCCWTLNGDFTKEEGATLVVPYSHTLRRHPTPAELALQTELAIHVEAKRGEIVCWDGSVWHSFGLRTIPGERVVIHTTFCRLTALPLYNYGKHRNVEQVLARNSGEDLARLRSMLMLEPWNKSFLMDPTRNAEDFKNMGGARMDQLVTRARGMHGAAPAGDGTSGRRVSGTLKRFDELKARLLAKL